MKIISLLKRSFSLIICLIFIGVNCNLSSAKANTFSVTNNQTVFNEDIRNNPEVSKIDELANVYFTYYKNQGVTRDNINKITFNSDKVLMASYAGALDYSLIMQQVGYTYNVNQIAYHLATIGIFMQLQSALPFLDLIALLVGAAIVTLAIAIIYAAIAVGVNDLILTWYIYSGVNLTAAKQNTVAIVAEYDNGTRYWRAYLANYGDLGGIFITTPLNYYQAKDIVLLNRSTENVFAMHYSDAAYLATYSYGNGYINPEAHRGNGKELNMQHTHAITGYSGSIPIHGLGHIFFAIPIII